MDWHALREGEGEKLRQLAERYHLHPLHLEDCEHGGQSAKLEDGDTELFNEIRARNNKAFADVGHTREGTMDAAINLELAHAMFKRSEKLDDLSRRIHFEEFALCLTKTYRFDGKFCWRSLGQDVGKLFMRPTPLVTMLGSMDKPEKVRMAAQKRVPREKLVETRPEELIQEGPKKVVGADGTIEGEEEEECNEATYARITAQDRKIDALTKGTQHVSMLKMLVDEKDHVQTVENFFDFAFLIKDKKVEFCEDVETKQPKAKHQHNINSDSSNRESQQLVLSLNMKDVKRLAAALAREGNECPLHRNDELYDARDAQEQAEILSKNVAAKLKASEQVKAERRTQKTQASQAATQKKR